VGILGLFDSDDDDDRPANLEELLTSILQRLDDLEETAMSSAKLTQALADLAAGIAAFEASKGAPDPQVAALEAQVADLTAQLATANDAIAADTAAEDAAAAQIEAATAVINPPAPAPTPAAALPEYTYSGDPTQPIDPAWTATGVNDPAGAALYTYSGDTSGQPATGDGLGGVWHLYTPPAAT